MFSPRLFASSQDETVAFLPANMSSTIEATTLIVVPTAYPAPTSTFTPIPSLSVGTVFYIIPIVTLALLVLICVVARLVPIIQFELSKPIVTQSDDIQVLDDSTDCGSSIRGSQSNQSLPALNLNRNSLRPESSILSMSRSMKLDVPGSLNQVPSNDSIMLISPDLRPVRSSAVITVGDPPCYNESIDTRH